jgi:quinol monooxygenase YgiN
LVNLPASIKRLFRRATADEGAGLRVETDGSAAVLVAAYACRVRPEKQTEFLSSIRDLVDRTRWMRGCLGCRLLADVHDPGAFTVTSEWTGHDGFDRFLESSEYRVLRGMTILMAVDVRFSVDDVVTRAAVSTGNDG